MPIHNRSSGLAGPAAVQQRIRGLNDPVFSGPASGESQRCAAGKRSH
jgi:hypothetical protein